MRPDFIPPGQEATFGIGETGRFQDYVPGPLPDDLPLDQGGTGLAVPPDPNAPTAWAGPEVVAVPDPGPPASAVMSPGPMAEPEAEEGRGEKEEDPSSSSLLTSPAVQPLMVPPPELEPAPPKLTKAEREAIAAKAVEEARRLQEEADRHDEEEAAADVPEAGQKGGQAKSGQKPKGK